MRRMGILAGLVCLTAAVSAEDLTVKLDMKGEYMGVDPELTIPKGAQKLSADNLAYARRKYAEVIARDISEDIAWEARVFRSKRPGRKEDLALVTVNRGQETVRLNLEFEGGLKPLPPVYRRVFSTDGGKTWDTEAFQPPQHSLRVPWTVEVPSNSVQLVTIWFK